MPNSGLNEPWSAAAVSGSELTHGASLAYKSTHQSGSPKRFVTVSSLGCSIYLLPPVPWLSPTPIPHYPNLLLPSGHHCLLLSSDFFKQTLFILAPSSSSLCAGLFCAWDIPHSRQWANI